MNDIDIVSDLRGPESLAKRSFYGPETVPFIQILPVKGERSSTKGGAKDCNGRSEVVSECLLYIHSVPNLAVRYSAFRKVENLINIK